MTKQWSIMTCDGLDLNCYIIENYATALQIIQDELEDGFYDLDDLMIYELDELDELETVQ